jgi:hypothetical protein
MRRLAILVTLVLTTAAAPLTSLCGVDCDARPGTTVHAPAAEPACPLHEQPAPAERHHQCDHDHHVAPATAAQADSAIAGKDAAVAIVCFDPPAAVITHLDHHTLHGHPRSITRPPLRLFPLRI